MRRTLALLLVLSAFASATNAKVKANHMLSVVTPVPRGNVPAHPHVNVIVRFGSSPEGYVPDPATFHARIGRTDVTDRFRQVVENGAVAGMRAELSPPHVKLNRRNRLRFEVKSQPHSGPGPRVVKDIDRVRFRATPADNQPPVPALVPPSEVIFPDVDLQFDATGSRDPDLDELSYSWDFGDGGTGTGDRPTHSYQSGLGTVGVSLTVSDGALAANDQVTLVECPAVDDGRTPGILRVEAPQQMEFGGVATGTQKSMSLTVINTDQTATSQLRVQLRVDGAGFSVDPPTLDLGPAQGAPVSITFAPTAIGHRSGDVVFVASATNRCAVHVLAHGYGGTAPASGPTGATAPVFFSSFAGPTVAVLPAGDHVTIDTTVNACQAPSSIGNGDVCVTDDDCAANGGTCSQSTPGAFYTVDACSDGHGALYLMSDEGSYTDPTPTENDLSVTILRLTIDENGNRTGAKILARETTGTTQMSCDQIAAAAGGKLYVSEFREVTTPAACLRSEQESLLSFHKNNGSKDPPLVARMDDAEGLSECDDDIDQVIDLNVTPDGVNAFVSFEEGGIYQVRPSYRAITPDVRDVFQLAPDGDVIAVNTRNVGTTGVIEVYRMSPQQAASGPIHLSDITPCASLRLPNNGSPARPAVLSHIGDHFFAVGPASTTSLDGVLLVTFYTSGAVADDPQALPPSLRIQGVAAFDLPAGSASCTSRGPVALDLVESATF